MDSTYREIYKIHSSNIKVAKPLNSPAVIVVFSAIPGSGKSELTKRLVRDHGFTKIANKDIREAIEETGHKDDVVIGEYTLWLFDKLTKDDSISIVFDRNIDQWYEPAKKWAAINDYKFVVVRIDVSEHKLRKRSLKRESSPTAKVFDMMNFYTEQHKIVEDNICPTILLEDDYNLDNAARMIAKQAS